METKTIEQVIQAAKELQKGVQNLIDSFINDNPNIIIVNPEIAWKDIIRENSLFKFKIQLRE